MMEVLRCARAALHAALHAVDLAFHALEVELCYPSHGADWASAPRPRAHTHAAPYRRWWPDGHGETRTQRRRRQRKRAAANVAAKANTRPPGGRAKKWVAKCAVTTCAEKVHAAPAPEMQSDTAVTAATDIVPCCERAVAVNESPRNSDNEEPKVKKPRLSADELHRTRQCLLRIASEGGFSQAAKRARLQASQEPKCTIPPTSSQPLNGGGNRAPCDWLCPACGHHNLGDVDGYCGECFGCMPILPHGVTVERTPSSVPAAAADGVQTESEVHRRGVELGVDSGACDMLRRLPVPHQQEIITRLAEFQADGLVGNPSGFVVRESHKAIKCGTVKVSKPRPKPAIRSQTPVRKRHVKQVAKTGAAGHV